MLKRWFVFLIKIYQKATIFKPASCRFYPTCSTYSIQAIEKYGAFKGGWLTVKRIAKCHPWHPGGLDIVP